MKNPLSKEEIIRRLEDEISRRLDARETVIDRIERGNLPPVAAASIMRKAGRMMQRINALQTQLQALVQEGK